MNVNMNKAFYLKKEDSDPKWHVIDADGQVLGRMVTKIADILRGKDKPIYTPHTDGGDYVVIINAEKIRVTGKKETDKIYVSYSGWLGGKKEVAFKDIMKKDPTKIITHAVKGMLPKNKLNRQIIKKLKIYIGPNHPHKAQV